MIRPERPAFRSPATERSLSLDGTSTIAAVALSVVLLTAVASVLAVKAIEDSSQIAGLALVATAVLAVAAVVGSLRTVLLSVIVLDIPLQWDTSVQLGTSAPDLGGVISGLPVSATTFALAALYALWAASALAHGARPDRGTGPAALADGVGLRRDRSPFLMALPLLVYLGITALSILVASDPVLASFGVALLLEAVLLFVYIVGTVRSHRDVILIVGLLFAGLLLEGGLVLATKFVGLNDLFVGLDTSTSSGTGETRFSGTIGNPNVAGSYFAFLLAPALAAMWWARARWLRWLAAAAFAAGLIGLFLTFSRGGWLAFVVSAAVLAFGATRRGWLKFGHVALAGLVLGLLLVPFLPQLIDRIATNQSNAVARWPLIGIARDVIVDNAALGVGANNFTVVLPGYVGPDLSGEFIAAVHNKFLLIWAEAGVFALAAFVWFVLATIGRGWRLTRGSDPWVSRLALGLVAGFVGQVVHMMIESFHFRSQVALLALVAGLIGALALLRETPRHA